MPEPVTVPEPLPSRMTVRLPGGTAGVPMTPLLEPSTAAQNESDGHETAKSECVPSTFVGVQLALGTVGFVLVTTLPASSTATQRVVLGHEIARGTLDASIVATF